MIPLKDNIPSRTLPVVNYAMIAVCGLAFLAQLAEQTGQHQTLVESFGMIPVRVLHPGQPVEIQETHQVVDPYTLRPRLVQQTRTLAGSPFPAWLTLLTCIFLHGGWLHFLGNMWFLFIFGDNVEDRVGHLGYLLFYLFCGISASLAQLFANPASPIPTIGASGAIAGVMGAYLLLYPRALVTALVPIVFLQIFVLPAPVFLGIWFVIQFFQGAMSITSTQTQGVAWWAHVGGFAMGFLIAAVLRNIGETRPPVQETRPRADHITTYRYRR